MKKIFIIISSVLMVAVITLLVTLTQINKNVNIKFDNPAKIYVYNESTNPTKNDGYTENDEAYATLVNKINNMTNMSLFKRLVELKTLDTKVEQSKDGTFAKWTSELKSKNLVIELDFGTELQDMIIYENGNSRVISFYCISYVITKTSSLNDIIVYYSGTNDTTAREEQYAKCEPIVLKGYGTDLIKYIDSLGD